MHCAIPTINNLASLVRVQVAESKLPIRLPGAQLLRRLPASIIILAGRTITVGLGKWPCARILTPLKKLSAALLQVWAEHDIAFVACRIVS
jgi:hypothetical protein